MSFVIVVLAALEVLLTWCLYRHKTWLMNANARRKRMQRALKKQRIKYETLYKQHQSLIADTIGDILASQDREEVTKGLTRKLNKETR